MKRLKKLERREVLMRVRFANKNYDPYRNIVYKGKIRNISDLDIIRYDRKSWVEHMQVGNDIYFISLEDLKKKIYECLIVIDIDDLMHLTDCGYGFLKG